MIFFWHSVQIKFSQCLFTSIWHWAPPMMRPQQNFYKADVYDTFPTNDEFSELHQSQSHTNQSTPTAQSHIWLLGVFWHTWMTYGGILTLPEPKLDAAEVSDMCGALVEAPSRFLNWYQRELIYNLSDLLLQKLAKLAYFSPILVSFWSQIQQDWWSDVKILQGSTSGFVIWQVSDR